MINASRKWLKAFLVSEVRKLGSPVAPIFGIRVEFLDLSFFGQIHDRFISFITTPTTSSSLALNAFGANLSDDLVIFNREVSGAVILLKSRMKRQKKLAKLKNT